MTSCSESKGIWTIIPCTDGSSFRFLSDVCHIKNANMIIIWRWVIFFSSGYGWLHYLGEKLRLCCWSRKLEAGSRNAWRHYSVEVEGQAPLVVVSLKYFTPNIWALFDPQKIHPRPSQIIRIWLKQKKTSPKAQRTRGLSSAYQSNLGHITSSNTWSNFIFRISTKHQLQNQNVTLV